MRACVHACVRASMRLCARAPVPPMRSCARVCVCICVCRTGRSISASDGVSRIASRRLFAHTAALAHEAYTSGQNSSISVEDRTSSEQDRATSHQDQRGLDPALGNMFVCMHTHTHAQVRTQARTHARTKARMRCSDAHAHLHALAHTCMHARALAWQGFENVDYGTAKAAMESAEYAIAVATRGIHECLCMRA